MAFNLTNRKALVKVDQDYELLQKILNEYSNSINYSFAKTFYNERVNYIVSERLLEEESIRVWVMFKSRDVRRNPKKWGDGFRIDCIKKVILEADSLLSPKRTKLLVTIQEDFDETEERLYERD